MKKILCFLFFGFGAFGCLKAQSVSQNALVPQGEVSEIDGGSLEWTIGETIVHTVIFKDGILTQGTQQPVLLIESLNASIEESESILDEIDIQVYPNPTSSIININFASSKDLAIDIVLVDETGKNLIKTAGKTTQDQLQLDVSLLQRGIYFLHLSNKKSSQLRLFKIIKQ